MSKPANNNPKPTNINQKLDQLKSLIDWFHSEDFDLSQAVENYQKAASLAQQIKTDLTTLKNTIQTLPLP